MKTDVTKIIGYFILIPALFSLFSFIITSGGFTSAPELKKLFFEDVPQPYFGLMAIAGAYLIKE